MKPQNILAQTIQHHNRDIENMMNTFDKEEMDNTFIASTSNEVIS